MLSPLAKCGNSVCGKGMKLPGKRILRMNDSAPELTRSIDAEEEAVKTAASEAVSGALFLRVIEGLDFGGGEGAGVDADVVDLALEELSARAHIFTDVSVRH
jgi:hypothetical protein